MLYSAGRKGKFSVLADWILDVLGNFNLGYLSFFSNKYFLIIIYIKLVPNRLFCWTFFFLFIVLLVVYVLVIHPLSFFATSF